MFKWLKWLKWLKQLFCKKKSSGLKTNNPPEILTYNSEGSNRIDSVELPKPNDIPTKDNEYSSNTNSIPNSTNSTNDHTTIPSHTPPPPEQTPIDIPEISSHPNPFEIQKPTKWLKFLSFMGRTDYNLDETIANTKDRINEILHNGISSSIIPFNIPEIINSERFESHIQVYQFEPFPSIETMMDRRHKYQGERVSQNWQLIPTHILELFFKLYECIDKKNIGSSKELIDEITKLNASDYNPSSIEALDKAITLVDQFISEKENERNQQQKQKFNNSKNQ